MSSNRFAGGRAGFAGDIRVYDVQGTTLVLGTAEGSVTIPTNPRPHSAVLHGVLSAEAFYRMRFNANSTPSGGWLAENESFMWGLHPQTTEIVASVPSSDGTLYISYLYGGSAA